MSARAVAVRQRLRDALGRAAAKATPTRVAVLVLLWWITMRCALFGNPLIDHDDEFFLLVGDGMPGLNTH